MVRVKLKQENHQVWKVDIDLFIVSVFQKLKFSTQAWIFSDPLRFTFLMKSWNVLFLDPEIISNIKSSVPTRIAVAAEDLASPKDLEIYKESYENLALVGSGTFGSVYYAR